LPTVSLTTFMDFVAATGTARLTRVRQAKKYYEQGYSPQRDFYKPLRDRIEAQFAAGWDAKAFRKSLEDVTDPKKIDAYEECRAGLAKWAGRRKIEAGEAMRVSWTSGELEVNLNPELNATINGEPHLIKMYLKGEVLSKQKVNAVLHLLARHAEDGQKAGVLDVRRSKLDCPTIEIAGMDCSWRQRHWRSRRCGIRCHDGVRVRAEGSLRHRPLLAHRRGAQALSEALRVLAVEQHRARGATFRSRAAGRRKLGDSRGWRPAGGPVTGTSASSTASSSSGGST